MRKMYIYKLFLQPCKKSKQYENNDGMIGKVVVYPFVMLVRTRAVPLTRPTASILLQAESFRSILLDGRLRLTLHYLHDYYLDFKRRLHSFNGQRPSNMNINNDPPLRVAFTN